MKKGEESRQRLIECAAELFWKNGYSVTGISEILKQTGLPKGSFYCDILPPLKSYRF